MSAINSDISIKTSGFRKLGRFFIDHYEEMLAALFFIGTTTMAVLTGLGIVVISI